jgi:hypothetical protein
VTNIPHRPTPAEAVSFGVPGGNSQKVSKKRAKSPSPLDQSNAIKIAEAD